MPRGTAAGADFQFDQRLKVVPHRMANLSGREGDGLPGAKEFEAINLQANRLSDNGYARVADCRNDAAPVWIVAGDGGFYQRAVGNRSLAI